MSLSHHQRTTLGQCAIINDRTFSPKENWPFVHYLDTGSITDNNIDKFQLIESLEKLPSRARRKVKQGDIVYSTVRPNMRHFGILQELPDNTLVSTGFAVIRGIDKLAYTNYIYWFLAQDKTIDHLQTLAEHSTSAYPSIRPSDLENLEIILPPFDEQRAIAHVLDILDHKIQLNRQMTKTLEEIARALFKSWFVDFDPVRAKMDGRWQPGQSLSGLPAEVYDLFPDRLVSSELGEIPEGWQVCNVGDLANIRGGKQLKRTEFDEKGSFPVYGGAGRMGFANRYNANGFVITVGRVGAYCGNYVAYRGKAWVNNNASQVIPFEHIPDEWLFLALQELDMESIKKGAAQPFVSNGDIAKMKVVYPADSKLLSVFQGLVKPIILRSESNNFESAILSQLRDTLLPKLLSGEIRVM